MNIENIIKNLEITNIKRSLNSCRENIKKLNLEVFELEKEKKKTAEQLKAKESVVRKAIHLEPDYGSNKRKYSNDALRDAEFISRSAMDPEIAKLRGNFLSLMENIFYKKILIEVDAEHNKELLLDYQMAISLIPCFIEKT